MDKWSKSKTITKVPNPKEFEIIQMPALVARALLESSGCDLCGERSDTDEVVYYIAAIDQVYCIKCFSAWYNSATRYKSDIPMEEENCERIIKKLKDAGWWETPLM